MVRELLVSLIYRRDDNAQPTGEMPMHKHRVDLREILLDLLRRHINISVPNIVLFLKIIKK